MTSQDLRGDLQSGESARIFQDEVYNSKISVWMKQQKPDKQASSLETKQTLHLGPVGGRGLAVWTLYANYLQLQRPKQHRLNMTHPQSRTTTSLQTKCATI